MKKTLIVAATLLGALTANAQQPVGKFSITPKFGFSNNYTYIYFINYKFNKK